MPALCHFYPGLKPWDFERMTRREVSEFQTWMYRAHTEGGD